MKRFSFVGISIATLLFSGCGTTNLGPRALKRTHNSYNQEIVTSLNEQLLNNMVRMRYRDNPYFLEVNTITQKQEASGNLGVNFEKIILGGKDSFSGSIKPGISVACSEKPSIIYKPLEGKSFIEKLLTPIQFPIVSSMIQSGWRADRVLNLCVERINELDNAATASGPTPALRPRFEKFRRFTELLRLMQVNDLFYLGPVPGANFADLALRIKNSQQFEKEILEFKALAGLDPDLNDYVFKDNFLSQGKKKLTVRTRSLMGMLFFLSQGIDVTKADEAAGLVTVTKNPDGSRFDWDELSTCFLNVHSSESVLRPKNAFVASRYRNKWFYIADDDLESKTTFMLLTQVFTLQSSHYKSKEPLLVLSGN